MKNQAEAAKKLADSSARHPSDCVSALTTLPDKHGQQDRGASLGVSMDCSIVSAGQVEAESVAMEQGKRSGPTKAGLRAVTAPVSKATGAFSTIKTGKYIL